MNFKHDQQMKPSKKKLNVFGAENNDAAVSTQTGVISWPGGQNFFCLFNVYPQNFGKAIIPFE